jgi:hypothetical protein
VPNPQVAYFFDRDQGRDGDTVRLTIRPRSTATGGTHLLLITNTLGNAQTVWPLLVVE